MRILAEHRGRPATISYRSIDRRWTQWGWRVVVDRPEVQRFSGLAKASRQGFTLAGARAATVRTPRFYAPRRVLKVRVGSAAPRRIRTDAQGRLTVRVPARANPVRVTVRG